MSGRRQGLRVENRIRPIRDSTRGGRVGCAAPRHDPERLDMHEVRFENRLLPLEWLFARVIQDLELF